MLDCMGSSRASEQILNLAEEQGAIEDHVRPTGGDAVAENTWNRAEGREE